MHGRGKIIRRSVLAAVCILSIAILHVGGVFIAAILLFCWGATLLWIKIYKGGTRYIARTHAEEMAKAMKSEGDKP
jgi:hypothetical protein